MSENIEETARQYEQELMDKNKPELKKMCLDEELSAGGTKKDMAKRLTQFKFPVRSIDLIKHFENGERASNDSSNKKREVVVAAIINNKVPFEYYDDPRWSSLRDEIIAFALKLCEDFTSLKCIVKAGRGNYHDFDIKFYGSNSQLIKVEKVEWKYGASEITDLPEFVSPQLPCDYIDGPNFVSYWYNYVLRGLLPDGMEMPSYEVYAKQVQCTEPKCLALAKTRYKDDKEYNDDCKCKSNEKIAEYMESDGVKLYEEKFMEYLRLTQRGKVYMLYKDGKINCRHGPNFDNLEITSCAKTHNTFECTLSEDYNLSILLRWKNGAYGANPGFQVKLKKK